MTAPYPRRWQSVGTLPATLNVMPRARQHASVVLLGLLAFLVPTLLPVAPATASHSVASAVVRTAEETTATPLTVAITSLEPTTIPGSGPIIVTGTVTNSDSSVWRDVTLYPFIGFRPMTTEAELDAAMETTETTEVGQRIRFEGDYTRIAQLDVGETVSFRLSVPRKHLTQLGVTDPGVYWFGVHALGSGPQGLDNVADGRARTFLPLLPDQPSSVTATVIVPVRAAVTYAADGSVAEPDRWLTLLRAGGRLARLADLADTPGGHDVSWLVDPAVLAAVERLSEGNPARPTQVTGDGTDPSESPSDTPSSSAPATASTASARTSTAETTAELVTLAERWWTRMKAALQGADVLALPYGDTDLSGAADHSPSLFVSARKQSTERFKAWGIPSTAVNAPPGGQIDDATVSMLTERDAQSTLLVSDTALPEGIDTAQVQTGSLRLIAFDSATSAGGPAPTEPFSGTAMRQRILAEAAIRSITSSTTPLVAELPSRWTVDDATELGSGLRQSWLGLHSLSTTLAGAATTAVAADHLATSDAAGAKAVSGRTFTAATDLVHAGRTLQRVLTGNELVAEATLAEALTSVSYQRRGDSSASDVDARYTIQSMLAQITINAPRAVTLSGSSGRFAVIVTNGLDLPTTVALKPFTDVGITISTPKTVDIAPGASTTIVLEASDARVGVHDVRLVLMDDAGTRLGNQTSVPVRTAQVSKIIWVFIAVGCGLLFGAIGSRLFRRIRAGRRQADGGE
jgi:hypothetical protein